MPYLIETYDAPERAHLRQANYQAHLDFLAAHAHLLLACGQQRPPKKEQEDPGKHYQ